MEQTNDVTDGTNVIVTAAELASDPNFGGRMRHLCPFGEVVYKFRTGQTG